MNIKAVIVTFNRLELLKECIEAIRNQTVKPNEVIVINNGSTDGTDKWLDEQSDLTLVHQENLGASGGFYAGIKKAYDEGATWVWVMDDDAEPYKDSLENLVKHTSLNPAVICSKKIGLNGRVQIEHRGYFRDSKLISLTESEYEFENLKEVDYSSFVGILVNRNAIEKAGMPNNTFFIWYDDVEFTLRLRHYGGIFISADSKILHKDKTLNLRKRFLFWNPVSLPIEAYWKGLCGVRNLLYIKKHHANSPTISLIIHLFQRTAKILLMDDYKILRIKYLWKYCIQVITNKPFQSYTPDQWKQILQKEVE